MSSARNAASARSRAGGQRRAQRWLQSTCAAWTISTLALSCWCRSTAVAFRAFSDEVELVTARLGPAAHSFVAFAAVHEFVYGTNAKCQRAPLTSDDWGKPDP